MNSIPAARCSLPSRRRGWAWWRWSTRSCSWRPCGSRTQPQSDSANNFQVNASHLNKYQCLFLSWLNQAREFEKAVIFRYFFIHSWVLDNNYLPLCPFHYDHWPMAQKRHWCSGRCWGRCPSGSFCSPGIPWMPLPACLHYHHKHFANVWYRSDTMMNKV